MFCGNCGARAVEGARFCGECGTAMGAAPADFGSSVTQVAPLRAPSTPEVKGAALPRTPAARTTTSWNTPEPAAAGAGNSAAASQPRPDGTRRRGRGSLLWAAAGTVAVLAAGSVAAYAFWPNGESAAPGAAAGQVTLSAQPAMKWQKGIAQIAPALGCPATSSSTSDGSDGSTSGASCWMDVAQIGDRTVATVTKTAYDSDTSQTSVDLAMVGLDDAGNTKWTVTLPADHRVQCFGGSDRLWCLSTEQDLSSYGSDGSTSDPAPAQLLTYGLTDGKQVATATVPGGAESVTLAGATPDAAYVSATADSASHTYTISKVGPDGKIGWSRILGLSDDSTPQVEVRGGRAYVLGVSSAGHQVILDDSSGTPVEGAGTGQVIGLVGDTVVARPIDGGSLSVGQTPVGQDSLGTVWVYDSTPPLLLGSKNGDTTTYQLVDKDKPATIKAQVQGTPAAFCGGRLITQNSNSLYGLDPKDGSIAWTQTSKDLGGLWCADGLVVFRRGNTLVGLDPAKGTEKFQSAVPSTDSASADGGGSAYLWSVPEVTSTGIALTDGRTATYIR